MTTRGGPFTPEQTLKSLWTRLYHAANDENVTIGELAKRSDRELMGLPNLGKMCLAALRERYPWQASVHGPGDTLAHVNQLLAGQAHVNRVLGEAAKRNPKPRVIQIASDRVNLYLLRDDGTVWVAADNPGGWRKMRLPEEGE